MSRLDFLQQIVKDEKQMQREYDKAYRGIARLPLETGDPAKGKIVIDQTDQEAIEIIQNAIRQGAEMGEEEGIKQSLEEMKNKWPIP